MEEACYSRFVKLSSANESLGMVASGRSGV